MALSAQALAGEYLYELHNAADHVAKCAANAQAAARAGDATEAREFLVACQRSADMFEMRYRDAVEAIKKMEVA